MNYDLRVCDPAGPGREGEGAKDVPPHPNPPYGFGEALKVPQ